MNVKIKRFNCWNYQHQYLNRWNYQQLITSNETIKWKNCMILIDVETIYKMELSTQFNSRKKNDKWFQWWWQLYHFPHSLNWLNYCTKMCNSLAINQLTSHTHTPWSMAKLKLSSILNRWMTFATYWYACVCVSECTYVLVWVINIWLRMWWHLLCLTLF